MTKESGQYEVKVTGEGTIDSPYTTATGNSISYAMEEISSNPDIQSKLSKGETVYLSLNARLAVYLTSGKMHSKGIEIGVDVVAPKEMFTTINSRGGEMTRIHFIDLVNQFNVASDAHKIFSKNILGKE